MNSVDEKIKELSCEIIGIKDIDLYEALEKISNGEIDFSNHKEKEEVKKYISNHIKITEYISEILNADENTLKNVIKKINEDDIYDLSPNDYDALKTLNNHIKITEYISEILSADKNTLKNVIEKIKADYSIFMLSSDDYPDLSILKELILEKEAYLTQISKVPQKETKNKIKEEEKNEIPF